MVWNKCYRQGWSAVSLPNRENALGFHTDYRQLISCLAPPARRFCARDQTYLVLRCPTSPPAVTAKPRPTPLAPSPPPWQLILMRTSSDISKDGLQRTLRNRYCPPQRCFICYCCLTVVLVTPSLWSYESRECVDYWGGCKDKQTFTLY